MSKLHTVDFTKTQIKLDKPAKRIACLTSAALDVLRELDLEPIGYLTKGIADKSEFYGLNNYGIMRMVPG